MGLPRARREFPARLRPPWPVLSSATRPGQAQSLLVHFAAPPLGLDGALDLKVGPIAVQHRPILPAHAPHQVAFRAAAGEPVVGESVPLMRNSALEALCGRLGYAPCRDVSAGRGGGARVAVRIILLGLGQRPSESSQLSRDESEVQSGRASGVSGS